MYIYKKNIYRISQLQTDLKTTFSVKDTKGSILTTMFLFR